MTRTVPEAASSLSDYEINVTTSQRVSLERDDVDIEWDYVKHLDVELLKVEDPSKDPVLAGHADGVIVLGSLAAAEGSSLSEVCDAVSEELNVICGEIAGMTEQGVSDADDLAYIDDLQIFPGHELPGIRKALFEQVIRTLGIRVNYAATWSETFQLERTSNQPEDWRDHLPERTIFLADTGVVIWDRKEEGHLAWLAASVEDED